MPLFYYNLDKWPIAGTGAAAQRLAGQVAGAYIAFARTGAPTVPGVCASPAFEPSAGATVVLDTETRVENAPDRELLALIAVSAASP